MLIDSYPRLLDAYKERKIDKTYLQNSIDVILSISEYRMMIGEIEKFEELQNATRKEM